MGMRFRKSFKVAPGVKVNLGKKSVGVSVGGKYGGVSVNSKTGARARVSAPGTGISYSEKIGGSKNKKEKLSNYTLALTEMSDDELFDYSETLIELAESSTTDDDMMYYTRKLEECSLERDRRNGVRHSSHQAKPVEVNATIYLLLTIFFGYFGVHRFYRKQIGMGILYLLTAGLFGFGWLVDIVIAIKWVIQSR